MTKYGSGGWLGFIVIPKARKGQGLRSCASELRKAAGFLDMPYGASDAPLPHRPFGGSLLYGVGGASLASMGKSCGLGGSALAQAASLSVKKVNGYRSFVAALKRRLASL